MNTTKRDILDHGFVRYVDHMGDDTSVVQAARVSYGDGTKSYRKDRGLIRYLMRHRHTSPFEMCRVTFHIKIPIFIARQALRHRTASLNEYSARYSVVPEESYTPETDRIQFQNLENKQGSIGKFEPEKAKEIQQVMTNLNAASFQNYNTFLEEGLSREVARSVLPQAAYTEMYWSMDLHNLFHFLYLRMDEHAQYEIRVLAHAIFEFVKELFPVCSEAFEDYRLNAVEFSGPEMQILHMMHERFRNENTDWITNFIKEEGIKLSKSEVREFLEKIE